MKIKCTGSGKTTLFPGSLLFPRGEILETRLLGRAATAFLSPHILRALFHICLSLLCWSLEQATEMLNNLYHSLGPGQIKFFVVWCSMRWPNKFYISILHSSKHTTVSLYAIGHPVEWCSMSHWNNVNWCSLQVHVLIIVARASTKKFNTVVCTWEQKKCWLLLD